MNKKILIGSIIATAVLIGVSFTSVVGYNSVASDVKASPLFNIRTSRAIDEEREDFRCEYVGKGEEITIPLPTRDNMTVLIQRVISVIGKMDVATFDKFINFVINHLQQGFNLNDITINKIFPILKNLKIDTENKLNISEFTMEETYCYGCGFTSEPLFCFTILLLLMIFFPVTIPILLPFFIAGIGIILLFILFFIFDMFLFTTKVCYTTTILC